MISSDLVATELPATANAATAAWKSYRATTHFGSLDGLRCLSILAVIWYHGPGEFLAGIGGRGHMGVPLFFAISGFLITTLLLRENERNGTISLRKFYLRRSLRIFPLYFAVLGIYCILIYLVARNTPAGNEFFAHLPYFLTYTSNWFVGRDGTFAFAWSLAAEEQFYSTWPSVIRYLRPARAVWVVVGMLAITITVNLLGSNQTSVGSCWLVAITNVPMAILWGCLAAFGLHDRRTFTAIWKILVHRATFAVLLAVIIATLMIPGRVTAAAHFLFGVLVASSVIREDHVFSTAMRYRWVVHIGSVSYGMYLLHGLAYDGLGKIEGHFPWLPQAHSVVGFILAAVVTIGLATLSFRFLEAPFLRLKARFVV
jgi:peptidoglycan/LPS O-acetylase OafA/YrhL